MLPIVWPNLLQEINPIGFSINPFAYNIVIFSSGAVAAGSGSPPPAGGSIMPEIFAMTSGDLATGNVVTLDIPAGVQEGDFLMAFLSWDSTGGIPFAEAGAASGWKPIADYENIQPGVQIIWKFAGASEPDAYTFQAGAAAAHLAIMIAVSGVNSSNPIGQVRCTPDTTNQMDDYDPGSTVTRFSGRNSFISQNGVMSMRSVYDNCLVLAAGTVDGSQLGSIGQNLVGYEHECAIFYTTFQALTLQSYPMPVVGMSPATALYNMASDSAGCVSIVLQPETLEATTEPSVPYIFDYMTRYYSGSADNTCQVPSGLQADDLIVIVGAVGQMGIFEDTCVDDVSGASGWTREIYHKNNNISMSVWSKVSNGSESVITYNHGEGSVENCMISAIGIRNATSGILAGASGVSEYASETNPIGPALPLNQDGTLAVYSWVYRGTSNANLNCSWGQMGTSALSGLYCQASLGTTTSIAHVMAYKQNSIGSGVDAPAFYGTGAGTNQIIGFTIF